MYRLFHTLNEPESPKLRKDSRRMGYQEDSRRITNGWQKDSRRENRKIYPIDVLLLSFAIRLLSASYPFAILGRKYSSKDNFYKIAEKFFPWQMKKHCPLPFYLNTIKTKPEILHSINSQKCSTLCVVICCYD